MGLMGSLGGEGLWRGRGGYNMKGITIMSCPGAMKQGISFSMMGKSSDFSIPESAILSMMRRSRSRKTFGLGAK